VLLKNPLRLGLAAAIAVSGAWLRAQDELPLTRGRLFSLQRSQDDIHDWLTATEDIGNQRWTEAVERLHELLQRGRPGIVPLDKSGTRFLGLRYAVILSLRELPPAGLEAYEKLVEREAGALPQTALRGRRAGELGELALRFPVAAAGRVARVRLGDLALEAGDGVRAEQHYTAARDATPRADPLRQSLRERLAAARALIGSAPETELGDGERAIADDARVAAVGPLPKRSRLVGWSGYGGGGSGRETMDPPLGAPRPAFEEALRPRGSFESRYSLHAVGGLFGVYVNDGLAVRAFDPLRGKELWRGQGPLADTDVGRGGSDGDSNVNPDTVLAAAVAPDLVVAALQVPSIGENVVFRGHIPVINLIPTRRLFAFDRTTGKLRWSHFDTLDGPLTRRFRGHDVAGPPLVHGDTVYVATHDPTGAIAFYLAAYDLRTGESRWRRLVCSSQLEVNMFGNARFEFAASPLCVDQGVLFGATNLGVCFAADCSNGELRWVTAYPVIDMPQTRLTAQVSRPVYFSNNPPVVAGGVVAFTPLDSEAALGIDAGSGQLLWSLDWRAPCKGPNDVRWLLGAIDDEFLFSGRGVVAVRARSQGRRALEPEVRSVCSPQRLGVEPETRDYSLPAPRGAIAGRRIYVPTADGLLVFDQDGNAAPETAELRQIVAQGNLLLVSGVVLSANLGQLSGWADHAALLQAAEQQARHAGDAESLLALATLVRGAGGEVATEEAEKHYARGLQAAQRDGLPPDSAVRRLLGAALFDLTLQRSQRLARTHPDKALAMLRAARDAATSSGDWLLAQEQVLSLLAEASDERLAELELMRERHGDVVHQFPGFGRTRVVVWALWQAAQVAPPEAALQHCQQLIDRWPTQVLGGTSARARALLRQRQLLEQHGTRIYAQLDAEAARRLAAAGDDADLLRAITTQYPYSEASKSACVRLLDVAIQSGDAAGAYAGLASALTEGRAPAGVIRRVLEVARNGGNLALARRLRERLQAESGTSDLAADQGRSWRDAVPPIQLPAPAAPALPAAAPTRVVARHEIVPQGLQALVRQTVVPEGFPAPEKLPLYVVIGERLHAFDLAAKDPFATPVFAVEMQFPSDLDPWPLCGDLLLVTEGNHVRALQARTGEPRWQLQPDQNRLLSSLGVHDGVLVLFSALASAGDGGALLGVEPLTGTLLWRHVFPARRESVRPAIGAGHAWVLEAAGEQPHVLRIDLLTGQAAGRTRLPADALEQLGCSDRDRLTAMQRALQEQLLVDSERLYFASDSDSGEPRVVAVDLAGKRDWGWRGERNRLLRLFGRHQDRIVLLEVGERSRVVLLDRARGTVSQQRELAERARCANLPPGAVPGPLPDVLWFLDDDGAQNLTCLALDGRQPSFRHALPPQFEYLWPSPQPGADFVAVLGTARNNQQSALLHVVSLQSGRRSLLPGGRPTQRLELQPPLRLWNVGGELVVQTYGAIALLGDERRINK
jgi:outer membrane protein assembly factor BamB